MYWRRPANVFTREINSFTRSVRSTRWSSGVIYEFVISFIVPELHMFVLLFHGLKSLADHCWLIILVITVTIHAWKETIFDTKLHQERIEIEPHLKNVRSLQQRGKCLSRSLRCSIRLGMTIVCIKNNRNIPSCEVDSTSCGRKRLFCFRLKFCHLQM